MAAKIKWHWYGTKLRHCHPLYRQRIYVSFFTSPWTRFNTACMVCVRVYVTVRCPSVCLSVPSVDRCTWLAFQLYIRHLWSTISLICLLSLRPFWLCYFKPLMPIQIGLRMLTSLRIHSTACISTPTMVRHDICRHSYAVERGLVVGFCGQPHYCYGPYSPKARFWSLSSYMVSGELFPDRSRPMSC